jgi:hypothetical protein
MFSAGLPSRVTEPVTPALSFGEQPELTVKPQSRARHAMRNAFQDKVLRGVPLRFMSEVFLRAEVCSRQTLSRELLDEALVTDGEILEQIGVDALGEKLHASVSEQEKCASPRMSRANRHVGV